MHATQVQMIFRERLGLRIGPSVAEYVAGRIRSGHETPVPPGAIPVMASDARTGAPVRRLVELSALAPMSPTRTTPDA
jgi:hypothetical protein